MNTPATSTSSLLVGRYRLHEKLGDGRLAAVYHATDETLQRSVLLHILRPELASQEPLRQRFVSEVNASARRTHSALLEVYDSGESEGRPYMVTEYIQGRPLHGLGVQEPERALLYLRQVAGAVALCQAQNVPCPPISSSNVLIVNEGQVKLIENWQLDHSQAAFELAHYRAPELSQGEPPGPASAVYALGLLLYELLTGSRPVQGSNTAEVVRAHLSLQFAPVSRLNPRCYLPVIDTLVRRATERAPEQRLASAVEFAAALEQAWRQLNTETRRLSVTPAQPAPRRHEASRFPQPWPRRRPTPEPQPAQPASARPESRRPEAAPPARRQQHPVLRTVTSWLVLLALLLAVVVGSYAGASFLADRFFAIELPQIRIPQINLPQIDLEVPDWIQGSEPNEILIVNINEGLNLRDEPGLSTEVIAVVPNGAQVEKLEGPITVDNVPWVRIQTEQDGEQLEGWMSRNFLLSE
jgi:serine/threonine protein kinase